MKKIFTIALAIMMIAVMSVSVFAADEGTIYASELVLGVDYIELGNMSLQGADGSKGAEAMDNGGCLGLGPIDYGDGEFSDAFIQFTFTVETAGEYDITVRYAAKHGEGQTRCADAIVNGGERIELPISQELADWNTYENATITVELKAGENTVKLVNREGFDNSTLKAINVLSLSWAPFVEETEGGDVEGGDVEGGDAEGGETPNDPVETPDDGENAPQTGFATVALAIAAVMSGAYIVTKKH